MDKLSNVAYTYVIKRCADRRDKCHQVDNRDRILTVPTSVNIGEKL